MQLYGHAAYPDVWSAIGAPVGESVSDAVGLQPMVFNANRRCPSSLHGIDSDLGVGSSVGQRVGADVVVGLHIGNGLNTGGDSSTEVWPVASPRSRIIRRHRSRWSRRCYGRATQHSSYLAASAFAMSVKPRASVCLWLTSESERRSACESAQSTAAPSD